MRCALNGWSSRRDGSKLSVEAGSDDYGSNDLLNCEGYDDDTSRSDDSFACAAVCALSDWHRSGPTTSPHSRSYLPNSELLVLGEPSRTPRVGMLLPDAEWPCRGQARVSLVGPSGNEYAQQLTPIRLRAMCSILGSASQTQSLLSSEIGN